MATRNVIKKADTLKKQKTVKSSRQQEKTVQVPAWSIYALLALTAIIYSRALFNGFAHLDDDTYLLNNPYIRNFNFETIKSIFSSFYFSNYHPLTTLTYLFEFQVYGLNPLPYHALNIMLHLVNTLLVWKLAEKLSGTSLTALIVAALFALHPMHVESVAWLSERKDVLYTLFYLSALLAYLNYLKSGFKMKYYWICLLLFICSLLSKSAAVTLPVLMIAIDLYLRRKWNVKILLEKIPFFALSVLFGVLAIFSQKAALYDLSDTFTFFDNIFLFSYTVSFYLVKLILPIQLSAMHYFPVTNGGALPWLYYASLPFLLIIVWLTIRRTNFRREKLFGAFFFLIAISVMLQIIGVGSAITAERYSYVAYFGLFYLAGQWVSGIQKTSARKTAIFLSILFIVVMSGLTWDRISIWKSGDVLMSDVIKKYPDSYHAYWTRGDAKSRVQDYQGTLKDYNKALQLKPDHKILLSNRGLLFLDHLKDYDAAVNDFSRLIQIDPNNTAAYNNRGKSYDRLKDTAAALRDFNKAILLNPGYRSTYLNRGILKATMGNLPGGLEDLNKAVALDPKDGNGYINRANIRALMKDYKGSIDDYNIALKLNPEDHASLFNRGVTRLNMNDTIGACEDWHKAQNLGNPDAANAIQQVCKH